ncbi:hypothetical protein OG568_60995 (plasmid) [Streptomyces sp. NBC_01450]|nr:hypothetical protein [Streptomyces sp. NBC_01450]
MEDPRVPGLGGHRDWMSIECPGEAAHLNVQDVREEAAAQATAR